MRFVQDFTHDFSQFLLPETRAFAFARFGDGEYSIIEGMDYKAKSGWTVTAGPNWIRWPLTEALRYVDEDYYVGISAPCDDSRSAAGYRSLIEGRTPLSRTTFSSIFAWGNWVRISQIRERYSNAVIVGCGSRCDFSVPLNGMADPWDINGLLERLRAVKDRPILVAAGPCADVIIHRYWSSQPPDRRVSIIDIGSAYDIDIHGKPTREYQSKAPKTAPSHKCRWDDFRPFRGFTDEERMDAFQRHLQSQRFAQMASDGFTQTVGSRYSPGKAVEPQPGITGCARDRRPPGPGNNPNIRTRLSKGR